MPISDVEKIVRQEPLENCYEIGKELGRGKFAIVKRCTEKATGAHYAAKILKKRRRGKSVREDILMEIDIMRQGMDHNRIIKLYEVFESKNEFHIIIELAMGGELFRVISVDPLPEVKARDVVTQILEGVQHLHSLNIVHMDLKPENLLLYRKGSLEIKIVDFGLAVQLQEGQEMKSLVGTAEYVSPEILSFEPLSTYSDMWSIGALTYALLAGYSPFQGETHQETFLNVSTCDYDFDDEVFDAVSSDAKDFIEKLLVRSPRNRLTAEMCLQHPWVRAHLQTSTTTNNLDGSMSSLDSALCMDSASSMEPSPVSSASSSFSPAPSATSRSGGSAATTTTTTSTTATTTGTTSSSTTTELSRPEDMKKVNDKLSQISKLATEQLVAATATKPRPEGSPTSTTSSTGTLKGDEVAEPVVVESGQKESKRASNVREHTDGLSKAQSSTLGRGSSALKEAGREEKRTTSFERETKKSDRDEKRTKSFECETKKTEKRTTSFERETKKTESDEKRTISFERETKKPERDETRTPGRDEKRTTSFERETKKTERDEKRTISFERETKKPERDEKRTTSFERETRKLSSPRPGRTLKDDISSLDPKTVQSIERFQRIKEKSRMRETESSVRLLLKERSPEPGPRSNGETVTTQNYRSLKETTLGEKSEGGRVTPGMDMNTTPRNPSPNLSREKGDRSPTPISRCLSPKSVTQANTESQSLDSKRKVGRPTSPTKQRCGQTMTNGVTVSRADKTEEKVPQPMAEEQKKVSEEKNTAEDERERARKEREREREERRRARKEEERRREEECKRLREEAERKVEEERKRTELEREKAREARRREREKRLAQRDNSSSSGSSESLDRSKWACPTDTKTSDVTTQSNDTKPRSQRTVSSEEVKAERELTKVKAVVEVTNRRLSQSSEPSPGERKSSSEFFQFGTVFSGTKNGTKSPKSPKGRRHSSQQQNSEVKSPEDQVRIDVTSPLLGEEISPRSTSPMVVISPSPPLAPEPRENRELTPTRKYRECSPTADNKRHRRKTPVISTDALDAILRGEVEDESDVLHYATEPNIHHKSQLPSCPEEDESQEPTSQRFLVTKAKSPDTNPNSLAERREAVLPSALRDPTRSISPEKRRVTLITTKERTNVDHIVSPERKDRSSPRQTPSPSPDSFTKSYDASRMNSAPKPEGVSRLTVSGSYASLSRSTPDLSEILGSPTKKSKEARKVERSNSRRMGGRSRMDSYVTSTEHSSSYYHAPASPHIRSGRHGTMSSRLFTGGRNFFSKWGENYKRS